MWHADVGETAFRKSCQICTYPLLHKYIYRGEHRKSLTLVSWEGWQGIFSTQAVTLWECCNDIVFKEKKKVG